MKLNIFHNAQSHPECEDCGACCDGTWEVVITEKDLRREPSFAQYELTRQTESSFMVAEAGTPCPMLDSKKRCSVYRTRPDCCRRVNLCSLECNESRTRHGKALIDPGKQTEGDRDLGVGEGESSDGNGG